MDVVITYVDGRDPQWQKSYAEAVGGKALTKRYRDWDTLRFLLRGIEKHLPFVEKVHLIVALESQVPGWVNRDALHVVLHKDFMPEQFVPTFNSTSIEMFMHRVPGLAEEFVYFNDDMFPVMDCSREDFFKEGKSVIGFHRHYFTGNKYKKRCRNSDHAAQKALGLVPGHRYVRPQHTCSPMLRSQSEAAYSALQGDIFAVTTPLRTRYNLNQYLYLDYLYYKGLTLPGRISNKHLSPAVHSVETICTHIERPSTKMICINDVSISDENFRKYQVAVVNSFLKHFPGKSRYEK